MGAAVTERTVVVLNKPTIRKMVPSPETSWCKLDNHIHKSRLWFYGEKQLSPHHSATANKQVCPTYQPVIQVTRKEKSFASLRSHQMKQCNSSQEQGKSRYEIRTLWVIACSLFYFGSITSVSYHLFKDIQNWILHIFIKD